MSNKVNQKPANIDPPRDIRVSVRVPQKLKNRVGRIARMLGVDESDVVRMSLKHGLTTFEKPEQVAA